ncbi:MAG: hypothetical protein N3J91_00230 [Verrucomicrobiae bacterium]|nr:hypothetical protein [Verrucomicrobiae bacterium]
MGLPQHPVTLTPEQIADLNQKLSAMRHSINNHLALFAAAGEILQIKPESAGRVAGYLQERPAQISQEIRRFSDEFERVFGITREPEREADGKQAQS